jgi:hypothetical protein
MSGSKREITESPWEQGVEEIRPYRVNTATWGGSPSSPVVKLYDPALADKTATNLTGSASIDGDWIDTPAVHGGTEGQKWRLEVKFVTGGRTEECYGFIVWKR